MDGRFHYLGFPANPVPNPFKNLHNSNQIGGVGSEPIYSADTTLRLDSPSFSIPFSFPSKGVKRKWSSLDAPLVDQPPLALHLGHSSSSSDSKGSTTTANTSKSSNKESEEDSAMNLDLNFTLHLGGEKSSGPDKSLFASQKVDLQLSLSSGPGASGLTNVLSRSKNVTNPDEGSTGSPFFPQSMENVCLPNPPKSSVTCSFSLLTTDSQHHQQRSSTLKQCQFLGCSKGARGASSLCIAHGGGRRCQRPGCGKGAEGRTAFCKAHGGGRRCDFLGCTKSAEGRTDLCIGHGGGRRCRREDCTRAARGKSGLCIRHGGGKRCQVEHCTRSAEGLSGFCISHGGGRRCQYPKCGKGAQGSTLFCKAHGGGKRCMFLGCNKGAEGGTMFCKGHGGGKRCAFFLGGEGVCPKSVHGGTLFCVAHGGGKRCAVRECTKSARGRTDFCVRHGGGKRCKFQECTKSAQGSTDFCKAHGGGKRCSWGQTGSGFGTGDGPCSSFARGKNGLCAAHGTTLVRDTRIHGGATVFQDQMKPIFTVGDMNFVASSSGWSYFGLQEGSPCVDAPSGSVPEGRVHGGNLMTMLTGTSGLNFPSESGNSIQRTWM